jgi:RecB family endonuclease NucS
VRSSPSAARRETLRSWGDRNGSSDCRKKGRDLGAAWTGVNRHEIAERLGVTPGQVSAVKAVAARGNRSSDIGTDEIVGDAIETTFGLERDLQKALRDHIEQLEPGLTIIDADKEQTVSSGRMDITARDRAGATVVIELKAARQTVTPSGKFSPIWAT